MIPRLFKPDATDFNAVGYGPITTTIRATVTEELNQAPVLEMELLVTDPLLDTIIVGSIIAAKPNAVDPVQAFVVEEITKPLDGVIRIYAPHIAQHRAQLLILFTPLNIVGLDNVFAQLSRKTATLPMNNPFKFVRAENKTDAARRLKIDTPRTLRETMGGTEGSIIDVFSGEWAFDNFTCTLYSKRGRESGARVLYGRNMTDFNLDEFYDFNLDMSATGCVGWGQYEEDGTTKTIIGDLQVSDNAFDVFPYVRAAAVDFSEGIKYQHTKELVNNLAKAWLRVRGAIGTTAEVAFNHIDGGEDIGMGDTIRIYNNVYNYEARSRVVGLRYDVIAETYESVTIGEQRTTLSEAIQDTAGGGSYSYSGGGGSSVDPSTTLPIMDGTAAVGTEQTYARGDHVHPTDTSRVAKSGDTMTGDLLMDDKSLIIKDETISQDTTLPSSNLYGKPLQLQGKDGYANTQIRLRKNTDGKLGFNIGLERVINGSPVYHNILMFIDNNGNRSVTLTQRDPWLNALGLNASVVTPTLIATSNFSLVQSAIYKMGKFVYGSIILRCTANWTQGEIINLNNTLPAYVFSLCAVTNGQWDYAINKVVRAYFPASGRITINTSISAGQYVTIPIAITVN